MAGLSERDSVILDTIFDPIQTIGISPVFNKMLTEVINTKEEPELSNAVKEQLKQAIALSESQRFDEALSLFDEALQNSKNAAPVLNDRAQCLRLAGRDNEALLDLDRAIEISDGRGKAGVQALCQRATLFRYLGHNNKARNDWARAAEGGSSYAKSQLVAMNPYAAMCNAMLRKLTTDGLPTRA
ncbi:hypothetical protein QAD02_022234 [Eretmocerus hayati]|uniref:Uncharacterized protein n=1 Tax=Eretmocerus hayati TaxID=131215 RepID=A0ACC2PS55_9HYME|nr:hypothetical protein QAD02_022234 [Eretmocerus hayati]